jgi:hypothetical protein
MKVISTPLGTHKRGGLRAAPTHSHLNFNYFFVVFFLLP